MEWLMNKMKNGIHIHFGQATSSYLIRKTDTRITLYLWKCALIVEGLLVKTLLKTNKQYKLAEKCVVIKALAIRSDENSTQWSL